MRLMKKNYLKSVFILFIAAAGMVACNNSPEKKAEKVEDAKAAVIVATDELSKAREDSAAEYNKYKEMSEDRIHKNDSLIADLKLSLKEEKKEANDAYEKQLSALDEKNTKLKEKIQAYKAGDRTKWESFKLGFNQDMDALGKSISSMANRNMGKK